jgi:hypothetical protein
MCIMEQIMVYLIFMINMFFIPWVYATFHTWLINFFWAGGSPPPPPPPHPKQDRAPWINVIINKYIIQYHKRAKRLKPGFFTQLALHVNLLQS